MSDTPTLFTRLAEEAANGHLLLEPDAATMCAQACTNFLEVLTELRERATRLACKEAFGPLPSARALGEKFDNKATGPGGLADVLQQHIDTVTRMKALFDAAGKAYAETDDETRDRLAALHPGE